MVEGNKDDNVREFTRVAIRLEVNVTYESAVIPSTQTRDLSMSGFFVCCEKPLPLGADCDLELLIGEVGNQIRLEIKGRVERVTAEGMGFKFTEIELDSYPHLQNLVLYNSHNAEKVEQEFKHHVGLKRREDS